MAPMNGSDFRKLARDLELAGEHLMAREVPRAARRAAVPIVRAIRQEAKETLPRRGGFADYVGDSRITVRTLTGVRAAGVRIVGVRPRAGGAVDLQAVNRGRLRHPVFGSKNRWRTQPVNPGFWDEPVSRHVRTFRWELGVALDNIRRDIEKQ